MIVTFSRKEISSGVFRKKTEYFSYLKIQLTAEEREWIVDKDLGDNLLFIYADKGVKQEIRVKSLIYWSDNNDEFRFVSPNPPARAVLENEFMNEIKCLMEPFDKWLALAKSDNMKDRRIAAFRRASEPARELYGDMELGTAIGSIADKYELTDTQRSALVNIVGDIILGIDNKSELLLHLVRKAGISEAGADEAARVIAPFLEALEEPSTSCRSERTL